MNRRQFLGGFGVVVAGGLASMVPSTHEQASLEADLEVTGWDALDDEPFVPEFSFRMRNHRAREPITPAVLPWGQDSYSQAPWTITAGPETLPAGSTASYTVRNGEIPLQVAKPALLVVYDRGTEQRAFDRFLPTRE